jgi:hypothetical protein
MDIHTLTRALKAEAHRLGFDHCRLLPIAQAAHADFYEEWVAGERTGDMRYLTRHLEKRRNPALLADRTHGPFESIVVLASPSTITNSTCPPIFAMTPAAASSLPMPGAMTTMKSCARCSTN